MKTAYLSLPAILLLTACGGGGGGGEDEIIVDPPQMVTPTPEEIEDNQTVVDNSNDPVVVVTPPADPEVFTLTDINHSATTNRDASGDLISTAARTPEADTASFTATYNTDGTITLEQGSLSVTMTADPDTGIFTGSVGNGDETTEFGGFLDPRFEATDVGTALVIATDFTTRREGFVAVGFQTDAATANALSGTAEYRGLMNARITGPGSNADLPLNGLGGGRLNVDFDAGTIDGRFNLNDPQNNFATISADDEFPRIAVDLNSTSIADGVFNGTIDVEFKDGGGLGNPDLAFNDDGIYSGSLFGETGASAGGTLVGTIADGDDTLVFQGGFATDLQ